MSKVLLVVAIALGVVCVAFGLAAARQAYTAGWGLFNRREVRGEPALVLRYRLLSRRAGALALVLMLASKCAQ